MYRWSACSLMPERSIAEEMSRRSDPDALFRNLTPLDLESLMLSLIHI